MVQAILTDVEYDSVASCMDSKNVQTAGDGMEGEYKWAQGAGRKKKRLPKKGRKKSSVFVNTVAN